MNVLENGVGDLEKSSDSIGPIAESRLDQPIWVGIGRNHRVTERDFTVADFVRSLILPHAKSFGFAERLARAAG
jgi:hypothetical protein